MKQMTLFSVVLALTLAAYQRKRKTKAAGNTSTRSLNFKSGYSEVNGLKMYYEIYGQGKPLVLIHGGGSTIQTSFGRLIPFLAAHRQVIGVELQAHGRTGDRNTNLSFEQDAADVIKLLEHLKIPGADFLGFSNGGQTAIEIAIHYPEKVGKLILASAFYKRSAAAPQFWEGFDHATLSNMPQALQDGQLKANGNDTGALQNSFNKDVQRMKTFKGWTDDQMRSVKAATLVINSSEDVGSPESAVEMYRIIPHCELAVFPGGHGAYLGEVTFPDTDKRVQPAATRVIEDFLNKN
ncbi:alpha/beta hydrolase [Niabella ginsenosidivorans]|uniref:Alpha/beta hydrolase n=1 Tax=Niabella ginsenosidivorans TaxID=1176587 RepID=A0A1A9IAX2_9BACT|nr:alpha/beta hydrolase [Niabella ginsenosidivorans]ANH83714.1 alpha/beta hydrolase [Niabella ginsenosidivorans]